MNVDIHIILRIAFGDEEAKEGVSGSRENFVVAELH